MSQTKSQPEVQKTPGREDLRLKVEARIRRLEKASEHKRNPGLGARADDPQRRLPRRGHDKIDVEPVPEIRGGHQEGFRQPAQPSFDFRRETQLTRPIHG